MGVVTGDGPTRRETTRVSPTSDVLLARSSALICRFRVREVLVSSLLAAGGGRPRGPTVRWGQAGYGRAHRPARRETLRLSRTEEGVMRHGVDSTGVMRCWSQALMKGSSSPSMTALASPTESSVR